jgi:hypothetical protein
MEMELESLMELVCSMELVFLLGMVVVWVTVLLKLLVFSLEKQQVYALQYV